MNNIERSELVIAKVLSLLMEWGISERELQFSELALDEEEFGRFFFPCIEWLLSESIIRVEKVDRYAMPETDFGGSVTNPTLTSYGFMLLGQRVALDDETREEALSDRVKMVSEGTVDYTKVGNFFGGLLGSFTKSLG